MKPYKDRKVKFGRLTRVYRNLNKKKSEGWYSIQQQTDGKWLVVAHSQQILLKDCTLKVNPCGRQRVIREGEKNVHAYITGTLLKSYQTRIDMPLKMFTYNPYKCADFINVDTNRKVENASIISINKFNLNYLP